ncbi:hypothetical protein [Anoxybacteroides rupiense]|uniref:hypothetical protein n=1 Tax=Anoxybacteroides rupiense TaxID=311460 RepID=UPI003FA6107E
MQEINFFQIRPYNGGKREAFEELCCQVFRRVPPRELPNGSSYSRFRGAGGDGGVEAIWILPNGEKIGVQSKFFEVLGDSQFRQMSDSLFQAVKNHPQLVQYVFCLPFDPTGPRAGGRLGKSQSEKLQEWVQQCSNQLAEMGISLTIEFWTESVLRERLIAADTDGGLRRYWFDSEVLTLDWIKKRLEEARAQAGQRYSPQLSVKVPAFDALEAFACSESWLQRFDKMRLSFNQRLKNWQVEMKEITSIPEDLIELALRISEELSLIKTEMEKVTKFEYDINIDDLAIRVDHLLQLLSNMEQGLLKDLYSKYGENADTPSFRQFQAEFMSSFPTAKLDTSRDLLNELRKLYDWVISSEAILPRSKVMLLRGPAGVGKTHALVDHAFYRFNKGQVVFIFFGEDFHITEPWEIIVSKLGLSGNIGRDELWGMINSAAEATGQPAIIYIDALNETKERNRWKQWLPSLRQQVSRFPWVKLCVSCRDTFLDEVMEEEYEWPYFVHNGFVGREFDAIRQFFEFYKLEPPTTPLMKREFSNPLFLHLICKGLKGAGMSSVPLGSLGFIDTIHLLLTDINQRAANACCYDPRENKVTDAVYSLARKMAEKQSRLLPLEEAKSTVNAIFPVDDYRRSLFLILEKEGLISVIERRSRPLGPKEWLCRFTFERVADYLIAFSLMKNIDSSNIKKAFTEGDLLFAVNSDKNARENRGLLEAWSVILPEQFGIELPDVIRNIDRYKILLPIMFSGIEWRSLESFTQNTRSLIIEGLSHHESIFSAIDALLNVAVIQNHMLNAEFIHDLLIKNEMSTRDPFWCYVLHEDHEKQGPGWRLTEWALRSDLFSINKEAIRLWALILAWFCAASDRRVRDRATKGLTRLFLVVPQIIKPTLMRFIDIDDDYILERISLAAYSAILRLKNDDILSELSHAIYFSVFKNGKVPLNALIRDWFRLIMEYANQRNLLSEQVDINCFRPPYNSPWPINFPTEDDVAHLIRQDAFQRGMNLSSYGIGTDFARYILRPLISEFDLESAGITEEQVHRWFLKSVVDLGYPGQDKKIYKFDNYMIRKYGGGRSKPVWAERIGKKYYWILLQRLAGIFGDHLSKRTDPWKSKRDTSLPELQGIDLRDIDPTDLRTFLEDQNIEGDWWIPVKYDFERVNQLDHRKWIEIDDFPEVTDAFSITDNQGEHWIHLSLYYPIKKVMGQKPEDSYPYRNLATIIKTVIVSKRDITDVRKAIRLKEWLPDLFLLQSEDYRLLLAEYPNTITFNQLCEMGDISLACEIPGTEEAQITTINLLRGKNLEYDCSHDEPTSNLSMPSPKIINFKNLYWDGRGGWRDGSGEIQVFMMDNDKESGVLIKYSYLREYLEANSLTLIGIGYQEKLLVSGDSNGSGIHEVCTVFEFDGVRVKKISRITRLV